MSTYAALILAAGQGSRYRVAGGTAASKLLAPVDGQPMVRRVASSALASRATSVVVITGFERHAVEAALDGLAVSLVHNPDHGGGLARSLARGIEAVPAHVAGVIVLLGDMPMVGVPVIDLLIETATRHPGADAVAPQYRGHRGNPVLLARSMFAAAASLQGDVGARTLLRDPATRVIEVPVDDDGVVVDVDQPQHLVAVQNKLNCDKGR